MTDFPLQDCAKTAEKLVKAGCDVYQKWTCGKCGERVTANRPNCFTTFGHHEECGFITDLQKTGCNYAVHADMRKPEAAEALYAHIDGKMHT